MPKQAGLGQYTNPIQDGPTRRAMYEGLRYEQPRVLNVRLGVPTSATMAYVACPWNGRVSKIYAVHNQTVSTPQQNTYSFAIGGTTISGHNIVASTGATVGYTYAGVASPTSSVNVVSGGEIIRVASNGGATMGTFSEVWFTIVVDRD